MRAEWTDPTTSCGCAGIVTSGNECPSRVCCPATPSPDHPHGNAAIHEAVLAVVWFEGLAAPTNTSPVSIPYPDVPEHS
ncbi:MAG: hypothetical protein PHF57_07680 [Methanoregula sp.]|nr:hypothetical protein [Methanoregula sp.]MDD5188074.1 hypothetical protein [Methanoregula sp.]